MSVYEAINVLPGVSVESVDPFGLAAEQKNIRVRGVRGFLGAMTVEGVPNYGGNPMGPREYLYDTENFESIAVYKGATPADLGTGVGVRGGSIELRPRWPETGFGVDVGQGIGANHYHRTFLRLDSGSLPRIGTGLSLSYSYTDAEKWKGPGDLGPRNNVNLMLRQPTANDDAIHLWFNLNDLEQDLYRPDEEHMALLRKMMPGEATDGEREQFRKIHFERSCRILETPAETLFNITAVETELPPRARIEPSEPCAVCGEPTMPAKMETLDGRRVCRACV